MRLILTVLKRGAEGKGETTHAADVRVLPRFYVPCVMLYP